MGMPILSPPNLFNPANIDGCVFSAQLWKTHLQGASFYSQDKYGHLCTRIGGIMTPQGWVVDGDDVITIAASVALDNLVEFSYLAWLNTNKVGNQFVTAKEIAFSPANWFYVQGTTGKIALDRGFSTTSLTAISTDTLSANTKTFIAATMNSSNVPTLYINGVEVAAYDTRTNGVGTLTDDSGTVFRLGNSQALNRDFIGVYGESLIYNRALSAGEITRIYQATKWRFS